MKVISSHRPDKVASFGGLILAGKSQGYSKTGGKIDDIWAEATMAVDPVTNTIESSQLIETNVKDKPGRDNWSRCSGNVGCMWINWRRSLDLRVARM